MTRQSIERIALFALTFFAIALALDHVFGNTISFVKEGVETASATLGWMLALKWRNGTIA